MKVGVFYNSVTNLTKFPNKAMLMDNFGHGVRTQGDTVIEYKTPVLPEESLDAGFVLGFTLENNFRRRIIDLLASQGTPTVFVDSNILHYANPEHQWHRYSLNSVYPDTGTYLFQPPDPTKWQRYSQYHGVELQPWRQSGSHILILCQRPRGWNMRNQNQELWLDNTVKQIRLYSNRPIMIRMHPGDGDRFRAMRRITQRYGNTVTISNHANIRQALVDCWCAVGYNSTPNVVAAIQGIPVFLSDPVHSWAADVAFDNMALIENPPMPDRSQWINKIANIHWSNDEVRAGALWSAIKGHIASAR